MEKPWGHLIDASHKMWTVCILLTWGKKRGGIHGLKLYNDIY